MGSYKYHQKYKTKRSNTQKQEDSFKWPILKVCINCSLTLWHQIQINCFTITTNEGPCGEFLYLGRMQTSDKLNLNCGCHFAWNFLTTVNKINILSAQFLTLMSGLQKYDTTNFCDYSNMKKENLINYLVYWNSKLYICRENWRLT